MKHQLSYLQRPDGVTIAYSWAGDGPPLIFVPGWTTHLEWFWQEPAALLVEPLTHHLRLITYDKHGCGLSDRDRTDFSLESELLDVEALVDELGLERFYLMGMSEGGLAATAYAAKHPDRVDKLVLLRLSICATESTFNKLLLILIPHYLIQLSSNLI